MEKGEDKQKSVKQLKEHEPPGEYFVLIIFFIILCPIFMQSLKVKGIFQGSLSGPGSIPQIITIITLAMVIKLIFNLFKKGNRFGNVRGIVDYLFCKNNIILLISVTIYALILEKLHFKISTFIFLFVTMYLLDKKSSIKKFVISAATLIVLELIFSGIFKVILP